MPSQAQLLAAANHLRHLLNTNHKYRRLWMAHAKRSGGSPNIDAVSRVLAQYHWTHDYLFDWAAPEHHRGYKDRVARALTAEALSPQTLRLFVHAFQMTTTEHDTLIELLDQGAAEPLPDSQPIGFPAPPRTRKYRTISLHELHTIGENRTPTSHRTIHTIEALETGVQSHTYAFDTPDVKVRATHGATAGPIRPLENSQGFWCSELQFHKPLEAGQIRYFEYVTEFYYDAPPPPELRRGSRYPLQMLSMRVQFNPLQLPHEIHWTRWDNLTTQPEPIKRLQLDEDCAVCEVATNLQAGQIFGFTWTWVAQ